MNNPNSLTLEQNSVYNDRANKLWKRHIRCSIIKIVVFAFGLLFFFSSAALGVVSLIDYKDKNETKEVYCFLLNKKIENNYALFKVSFEIEKDEHIDEIILYKSPTIDIKNEFDKREINETYPCFFNSETNVTNWYPIYEDYFNIGICSLILLILSIISTIITLIICIRT